MIHQNWKRTQNVFYMDTVCGLGPQTFFFASKLIGERTIFILSVILFSLAIKSIHDNEIVTTYKII